MQTLCDLHDFAFILCIEVSIGILNFGIPKLSEYRFSVWMDNSQFYRTISDKHIYTVTCSETLVNLLLIVFWKKYLSSQDSIYEALTNFWPMKEVLYNVCHLLYVNHIIFIANVRTIFGHNPTSDNFWTEIYRTTRTSDGLGHMFFFLKLAPLVDTHPKPCSWNIQFVCEHSNVRIVCEYLTIFAKKYRLLKLLINGIY